MISKAAAILGRGIGSASASARRAASHQGPQVDCHWAKVSGASSCAAPRSSGTYSHEFAGVWTTPAGGGLVRHVGAGRGWCGGGAEASGR